MTRIVGENNEMLQRTLQLGISLLHGGNREVQKVIRNSPLRSTVDPFRL